MGRGNLPNTIIGALPPNSKVTLARFDPAIPATSLPLVVPPVRSIFLIRGSCKSGDYLI